MLLILGLAQDHIVTFGDHSQVQEAQAGGVNNGNEVVQVEVREVRGSCGCSELKIIITRQLSYLVEVDYFRLFSAHLVGNKEYLISGAGALTQMSIH